MIGKEEFWDDVKNELSKTMQTISYEIWIEKLEPVCFVDSTFVLAANTAMAKKTIDRSYLDQIREVVNSLDSFVTDVEIIVKDQEGEYLEKQSVSLPDKGLIVDEKYSHKNKGEKASPFLEKYTFETFVQESPTNTRLPRQRPWRKTRAENTIPSLFTAESVSERPTCSTQSGIIFAKNPRKPKSSTPTAKR